MTLDRPGPIGADGTTVLRAHGLTVGYAPNTPAVIDGVDLQVARGECVALIGKNGCGKSTLLSALTGDVPTRAGDVWFVDEDGTSRRQAELSRRDIAKRVAVMHQTLPPVPGLRIGQLVEQSRYAWKGALGMLAPADPGFSARALGLVGIDAAWAHREVDELSGGERQRVRLAAALAQRTPVLLLDEPTAHLDVEHQLGMLRLVRRLQSASNLAVVVVLHDIDHAARFSDRLIALRNGRVVANGSPRQVLTPGLLAEVFRVRGRLVASPDGTPRVVIDEPLDDEPVPVNQRAER